MEASVQIPMDVTTEIEKSVRREILDSRMNEMTAREQILSRLKRLNLGARATRLLCEDELDYSVTETRQILIEMGLVITTADLTSPDPVVRLRIEKLKSWRRACAQTQGLPAYRVLSNRALLGVASRSVARPADLATVAGVGPKTLEAYGGQLVELLKHH